MRSKRRFLPRCRRVVKSAAFDHRLGATGLFDDRSLAGERLLIAGFGVEQYPQLCFEAPEHAPA